MVDNSDVHQVDGATLLVRHLPEALSADSLKRLFSHYGATDFRPCVAGSLKNCAFVDFKDESLAARAQSHLHRLRFMGKLLAVEKAKPIVAGDQVTKHLQKDREESHMQELPPLPTYPPPTEAPPPPSLNGVSIEQHTPLLPKAEPIAPRLGINYSFPPHLEYAYPPPDGNILTNVVNALIAVPRFYTQVLHLMNKMNLPAPFRPALPTPPLPPQMSAPPKCQTGDLSSDESELESSEEENDDMNRGEGDTEAFAKENVLRGRKRAKREAILGPATDRTASHESSGLKSIVPLTKSIPSIKKKQPVLQIKIAPKRIYEDVSKSSKMDSENQAELSEGNVIEQKPKATREELLAGKMSPTEILSRATFKNYTPGNPSKVLYIKNLEKDVTREDLLYVYGAFFASAEEMDSQFNVKLMQEGRMRGQAFLTFPSLELAEDALATTHGFVLKGKPMIVHFGRNTQVGGA